MVKPDNKHPLFVGAIIQNSKGEILLQKRDNKAPTFKNCWTLFGGRVKKGETPKQAIIRELKEEISLTQNNIISCKIIQENKQQNGSLQVIFLIKTNAKISQMKLNEGAEMKFIERENLLNHTFAFNIYSVLTRYFKTTNRSLV